MTETSDGRAGEGGEGDAPIEQQVEPLMAADGVYDGVTIIGGGSEPGPDRSQPSHLAAPRKRPVRPRWIPALGIGGLLLLLFLAVVVASAIRNVDGDAEGTGVETSGNTDVTTEEADPAVQGVVGDEAVKDDSDDAAASAPGQEAALFAADDLGGFRPVTADEALAARTDGTVIQATAVAEPAGPVTVSEVTAEVENGVVTGTFELAEASGPFGVGFTIATPQGAVVASHMVQAMAEGNQIQTVGTTTTVNSTGFVDGGDELTTVIHTDDQPPTPIGADRTITIRWDLTAIVVPKTWGPLSLAELQLLVIVDGAPSETDSAELIAFRRASLVLGLVRLNPTLVFLADASTQAETITQQRVGGFVRAGLPQETAACLVEDIPLRVEILVSFRPAQQEPLLTQCLLRTQFFTSVAAEGLQNYVFDGTLDIGCLAEGLAVHIPDVATYLIFATAEHTEWPAGLVEVYAELLEVCVPLESFYLAQFGQYNFTDSGCPVTMTNHVLIAYSWLQFILEGILSRDAAIQASGQARFEKHVNDGYVLYVCVVQG